jgi:hypothetical protein
MEGIQFVVDEEGHRRGVLIDLTRYGELWEDFYDALLVRERESEPRESLEEVEKLLVERDQPVDR